MVEKQQPMTDAELEFSRPVPLDEIRGKTIRRSIEATEVERRRLAERLGLSAIDALTATVSLEALDKGRLVVARGAFDADVTQICVVTLEPLLRNVSESFEIRLAIAPDSDDAAITIVDPTLEDEPEPLEGDSVDLGELVAQHLSLALDPYPRAEGAELDTEALETGNPASDRPFAELAQLKPKV
jgi:uncharacterized metal-binding protein YceD (DUF177 family)